MTATLDLVVAGVTQAADGIRAVRLVPTDGAQLPPFAPGAHVRVRGRRADGTPAGRYDGGRSVARNRDLRPRVGLVPKTTPLAARPSAPDRGQGAPDLVVGQYAAEARHVALAAAADRLLPRPRA